MNYNQTRLPVLLLIIGRLLIVFGGCALLGWMLVQYKAPVVVWGVVEVMMLYLAWTGTGAIALSTLMVLGIVASFLIFGSMKRSAMWLFVPLNNAQRGASQLLLNWLLATGITFHLAFTTEFLRTTELRMSELRTTSISRVQAFWLLAIATNLGLSLAPIRRLLWS